MGQRHIYRDPWPNFDSFERSAYPAALRERTARQWWRRAREEYGSIHEFSQLCHALTGIRAPLGLLSALTRLISDEARHSFLCAAMARTLLGDSEPSFEWNPPENPWPDPPRGDTATLRWAADVVLCACCIGETLSRPLYEALALRITDPVPESVIRQILKDEHLHAKFGWESLAWLWDQLDEDARGWLAGRLAVRLRSFERSCVGEGQTPADLAGATVTIEEPGPDAPPNLGLHDARTYAIIFYDTIENEILPRFEQLGLDARQAWNQRGRGIR